MPSTRTLVIGAGQAGLAMSRCLTHFDIDHVVLERGRTAERWRSERWDSLRLLSPNWATRLPGWSYDGAQPDGFMTAGEVVAYLSDYADSFDAPVREDSDVWSLERATDGFTVRTQDTVWHAGEVVIATGWCDVPHVPALAAGIDTSVSQLTASTYRSPQHLPDGRVLVVGASATGVQIADELARSGREVTLAVGRHSRLLRRYRGMDIWSWLEQIGAFARTIDEVSDPAGARTEGSLQLAGRADHRDVDLPALQSLGVRLAGRLVAGDGCRVRFADDLTATTAAADARLAGLLAQIDDHIVANGLGADGEAGMTPPRLGPVEPVLDLDLRRDDITTIVWATGFRRPYPWLRIPVLDGRGEIAQRHGLTSEPGLYVLGQRFQHRRDANFIDGVRHDAAYVGRHIASRVRSHRRVA